MEQNGKLERVVQRIRKASGEEFSVIQEGGDDINARVLGEERTVRVNRGAVAHLTEDELAWMVAHEVAP